MSIIGGTGLASIISNHDTAAADQGNAYVALSPVPGTGNASFATSTTLAVGELHPDFVVYNPGPLTVYPLYLRAHATAASTNATTTVWTAFCDVTNRVTAGTALTVANCNPASANTSAALSSVGLNVLTAATTSRRFIGHAFMRSTIDIIQDVYIFTWGTPAPVITGTPNVATVQEFTKNFMPIAIPPSSLFGLTKWSGSMSAGATLEYEFGYIEK